MNAPVDERAAACDFLCGESSAETGDGTVCAERNVNVVNLAKLTRVDELLYFVYGSVEAVDNADVERKTRFVLSLLHGESFRVGSCGGLFAEDVFACSQRVDRDDGVHSVRCADGNGGDFGISKDGMVILNSNAAAVFFDSSLSSFGNDIAEIFNLRVGAIHIGRNMCGISDSTASDNANFYHGGSPLKFADFVFVLCYANVSRETNGLQASSFMHFP